MGVRKMPEMSGDSTELIGSVRVLEKCLSCPSGEEEWTIVNVKLDTRNDDQLPGKLCRIEPDRRFVSKT